MTTNLTPATVADGAAPARPCGCPDFALSRRRLLAGAAAATGAMAAASLFGDTYRSVAYGAAPGGNVVVVLSLRGGSDGLSIVVPKNSIDQEVIAAKRPDLAIPTGQLVGGDGDWGLHPALAPLVPMWSAGTFGAVHGVGLPMPNRSHFDAMEEVEEAHPGSNARVGWINRVVGLDPAALPEEQIQFGSSMLPTALQGPAAALGANSVNNLTLPTVWNDVSAGKSLKKIWGGKGTEMSAGMTTALAAVNRLSDVAGTDLDPELAKYPAGALQDVLANTAVLIKADIGAKMITIDYGDWDMHTALGRPQPGGWMYDHLDHLAKSLKAFFDDLGAAGSRVTLVTISEFGRRVTQNGSGAESGVDHGYGNAMLLLGAGVNGGGVRGGWTHLTNLNEGDVSFAQDYRSVLWEILTSRFAADVAGQRSKIFPGLSYVPVGAMV
jgi:uncharacterized protein (DUF1501 family)